MKGRKKTPTRLKMLQGTYRKDRAPANEVFPEDKIPDPPKFLSKEAKREWSRMSVALFSLGLLSEIDRSALSLYCQAWGRVEKYEKIIAEKGELYKTQNGEVRVSPVMSILNTAYTQLYKLITEFGLSPAARTRISTKKGTEKKGSFAKYG